MQRNRISSHEAYFHNELELLWIKESHRAGKYREKQQKQHQKQQKRREKSSLRFRFFFVDR